MAHTRQDDMHVQSVCSIGTVLVKDVCTILQNDPSTLASFPAPRMRAWERGY